MAPPRQPIRDPELGWGPKPGSSLPGEPAPGTAPAPAPQAPINWLGIPGLSDADVAAIDKIFRDGADGARERALAYLYGTEWFKVNYRGIGQGIAKGMFSAGEAGLAEYRAYVNQVQQSYRQFYGRDATGDEIESFLAAGYTPGIVGQIGAGKAYVDANRNDIQYLAGAFGEGRLDDAGLQAYGEQRVGRDSAIGIKLQGALDSAMQKMQRVFQGQLATSPLALDSLSQSQQRQRKPDISA